MKTRNILAAFFVLTMMFSFESMAQRGGRFTSPSNQPRFNERPAGRIETQAGPRTEYCYLALELTEEQLASFRELRLAHAEKRTSHQARMDELRSRKRTLMLQAEPDRAAINTIIDEMTNLQNAKMKERVTHRQAIRSMLTDDQRIMFDSRQMYRQGGRGQSGGPHGRPGMRRW